MSDGTKVPPPTYRDVLPKEATANDFECLVDCLYEARKFTDNVKMMLRVSKTLGVLGWRQVVYFQSWWDGLDGLEARGKLTRDQIRERLEPEKLNPKPESLFKYIEKDVYKEVLEQFVKGTSTELVSVDEIEERPSKLSGLPVGATKLKKLLQENENGLKETVGAIAQMLSDALRSETDPKKLSQLLLHMLDVARADPQQIWRYTHDIGMYPTICDLILRTPPTLFPVTGRAVWHVNMKKSKCLEGVAESCFSYELVTFFNKGCDADTGSFIMQMNCGIVDRNLFEEMMRWNEGGIETMKDHWGTVETAFKWNVRSPWWRMEGFLGSRETTTAALFAGLENAMTKNKVKRSEFQLRVKGTSDEADELKMALEACRSDVFKTLLKKGMGVNGAYLKGPAKHEERVRSLSGFAKLVSNRIENDIGINLELRVPLTDETVEVDGDTKFKYRLHVNIHIVDKWEKVYGTLTDKQFEGTRVDIEYLTAAVSAHIAKLRSAHCNEHTRFTSPLEDFKEKLAANSELSEYDMQNGLVIGFKTDKAIYYNKDIILNSPSPFHKLQQHDGCNIQIVQKEIRGYPYDPAARFGEAWEVYKEAAGDTSPQNWIRVVTLDEQYTLLPTKGFNLSMCDGEGKEQTELPGDGSLYPLLAKSGTAAVPKYRAVTFSENAPVWNDMALPKPTDKAQAKETDPKKATPTEAEVAFKLRECWDLLKPLYPGFSETPPYLVQERQLSFWEAFTFCRAKSLEEIVFVTVHQYAGIMGQRNLLHESCDNWDDLKKASCKVIAVLPAKQLGENERTAYCGLQWAIGNENRWERLNTKGLRRLDSEAVLKPIKEKLDLGMETSLSWNTFNRVRSDVCKGKLLLVDTSEPLGTGLVAGLYIDEINSKKKSDGVVVSVRPTLGARLRGVVSQEEDGLYIKTALLECDEKFPCSYEGVSQGADVLFSVEPEKDKTKKNKYRAYDVVYFCRNARVAPTFHKTTVSMHVPELLPPGGEEAA